MVYNWPNASQQELGNWGEKKVKKHFTIEYKTTYQWPDEEILKNKI
jgi:hypothetical protein